MSHFVIDWDDTIYSLRPLIARAISRQVGYEVLPSSISNHDWDTYFQVSPPKILAATDDMESREGLRLIPGMEGFLRELLFCGHKVTIVSARSTPQRQLNCIHTLAQLELDIPFEHSLTADRAADAAALGGDFLIDDNARSCFAAAELGLIAIHFGEADAITREVMERNFLGPKRHTDATNVSELRYCLRNLFREQVPLLPTVIGLTGKARAGKDAAGLLLRQMELGYQHFSFAGDLKRLASYLLEPHCRKKYLTALERLNPLAFTVVEELRSLYSNATEEDLRKKTPLGRRILQFLGTEIVRDLLGKDWWVGSLSDRLDNVFQEGYDVRAVITDVRFPNEVAFIERNAGILIEIKREGAGLQDAAGQHSSEALDTSSIANLITIENNGSLTELAAQLRQALKSTLKESVTT